MRYRVVTLAIMISVSFILTGLAQTQSYSATIVTHYPAGSIAPSRVTETRREANGHLFETRVVESPSVNGGWALVSASERESVQQGGHIIHVLERFFVPDVSGGRRLSQITEVQTTTLPGGNLQTIRTLSEVDINGHQQMVRREVQDSVRINASTSRTKTAVS